MKKSKNYFSGCLLGGALGDALGTPIELNTYEQIISDYGAGGILDLQCNIHGLATITDDTQMTLFTAEGLLRAKCRSEKKGTKRDLRETTMVVFRAYLRWLYTQGLYTTHWNGRDYDGWLVGIKGLYEGKQAGTTTITTLGKGVMGRLSKPINNSKNSGGVIRISPVGLFECREDTFELGMRIGAITHGHTSAYYATGAMALLINNIIRGMSITDGVLDIIKELQKHEDTQECIEKLNQAIALSKINPQSREALTQLGKGREAPEALAMGVYCALSYSDDLIKALRLAVNHEGDSGSIGSVTGSIVGAYLGKEAIPTEWLEKLQLAKEIEKMADDLYTRHCQEEDWKVRYPSW